MGIDQRISTEIDRLADLLPMGLYQAWCHAKKLSVCGHVTYKRMQYTSGRSIPSISVNFRILEALGFLTRRRGVVYSRSNILDFCIAGEEKAQEIRESLDDFRQSGMQSYEWFQSRRSKSDV